MAAGFTPKHSEQYILNDLTATQFLALAHETAVQAGWNINYTSNRGLVAYTNKGAFTANAEIKVVINNETATIQSSATGNEMVDWGRNKKNVNAFIAQLETLKQNISPEELDEKYRQLAEQFIPSEEDVLTADTGTTGVQFKGFLSLFKPVPGYFITPILVNLNLLIFILMAINGVNIMEPDSESLLQWGANFRPVTLAGEWWRLLTSCFIHIGIIHLLLNMYALVYIGILLEPYLGKTKFLVAYLLTGIAASVTSLWWHDLTISAGASGAIFGMYGVFLALLTTNIIDKTARKELLASIAVFVGYNLINGVKGGIDNAAHIGGLVSGLIIGYALIPALKKPEDNRLKFGIIGLLTLVVMLASFTVYKKLPNDIGIYETKMNEFATMENMALKVYSLPEGSSDETILYEIKDKGIYYWNESITLIDGLKDLDLPASIRTRNRILKEYCELRLKSYELLYKAVSEKTDQYDQELNAYNKKIEAKINELNKVK